MAYIGMKKPYIAVYGTNTGTGATQYTSGQVFDKAVDVDISVEVGNKKLYADDGVAERVDFFKSGKVKLGTSNISNAIAKIILGIKEVAVTGITAITDTNPKEYVYDDDMAIPYCGFGIIIDEVVGGVKAYKAVVLPKVAFSVPTDSVKTKGEEIDFQTSSIEAEIYRDEQDGGSWKKQATFTTEAQAEAYIKAKLGIVAVANNNENQQ